MKKISIKEGKADEAAIRDVFEASCAAWNRSDLDGYLASYWDTDKTIWISGGSLTRGKQAIAAAYKSRFSGTQPMGELTLKELEIDVLTAEDAIAFGRWMLVFSDKETEGFFTVQLKKVESTWRIVHDHSSTRV